MSNCSNSACSGCSNHSDKKKEFFEPYNKLSNIKKVISVMSGKGGVGKSFITSTLAVSLAKKGYKVGILDADITGPSIPKVFGIDEKAKACSDGTFPIETKKLGIKIMSINLLLDDKETPVVWRGPMIGGAVKQFWQEVIWGDIDILLIDMPPGTGDVPLTVFQTIKLDGAIIVTAPQDLVSLIVKKSYNMAQKMDINILGIIENMSYIECDNCNNIIYPFGKSNIEEMAFDMKIDLLSKIPLIPENTAFCDKGKIESIEIENINNVSETILNKISLK